MFVLATEKCVKFVKPNPMVESNLVVPDSNKTDEEIGEDIDGYLNSDGEECP